MAPRWKWKGAKAKALAQPISKSVSELQLSLAKTESLGFLSSCSVLLEVEPEQAELLDHCCFGRLVLSTEKVKKWVHLSFEEAFYLHYILKCIKISLEDRCLENEADTWLYMKSKRPNFPVFFKAYSHLRVKNWVLRSGLQYGVDFVAYCHHPSLVHSEYSVLVQSGDSDRLRVWSDIHCTVRLSGSVAKTLLTLYVSGNVKGEDLNRPLCLENYTVEEQTISRWSPELSREDETANAKLNVTTELDLSECDGLMNIQIDISEKPVFPECEVRGCRQTEKYMEDGGPICCVSFSGFPCLAELNLINLNIKESPDNIDLLQSLEKMDLRGNDFRNLLASMKMLSNLKHFRLSNCNKLVTLPKMTELQTLELSGCSNLQSLLEPSHAVQEKGRYSLLELHLDYCKNVQSLSYQLSHFTSLIYMDLSSHDFDALPESIR